jgi:hypothetical protein
MIKGAATKFYGTRDILDPEHLPTRASIREDLR